MSRYNEDIIQGKAYNRFAVTKSIVRRMKKSRSVVVKEDREAPPGTAYLGEIVVNPWEGSGVVGPDF